MHCGSDNIVEVALYLSAAELGTDAPNRSAQGSDSTSRNDPTTTRIRQIVLSRLQSLPYWPLGSRSAFKAAAAGNKVKIFVLIDEIGHANPSAVAVQLGWQNEPGSSCNNAWVRGP